MAVALCLLAAIAYWVMGRRRLRLYGAGWRWGARAWRAVAFLSALLLIALLTGPLDQLFNQTIWLRTVQVVSLLMVAGPLLVLGAPSSRLLRQRRAAEPVSGGRWRPVAAFSLFSAALLAAYLPPVYRLISDGWPHQFGQLGMVILAYAFWAEVIAQPGRPGVLSHIGRVAYLFASSAQVRILGLFIGFSTVRLYGVPLVDQQIAAGILMVPGVLSDLIVLIVCLYLWLAQDERRQLGGSDSDGYPALSIRNGGSGGAVLPAKSA